jgi:uncharacterized protein (TIGR03437 family)
LHHESAALSSIKTDRTLELEVGEDSRAPISVDANGILYVAISDRHQVLRVTPEGMVSVAAGNGTPGFSGDGGPAQSAQLRTPYAIAIDAATRLLIADSGNSRVRRVNLNGIISTIAGTGAGMQNVEGIPATQAELGHVMSIAADASGNIYVGLGGCIRKISRTGIITTVAGGGSWGGSGDGGPAIRATFTNASGLAVDRNGNLYIADTHNHRIRRVLGSMPFLVEPSGLLFSFSASAPAGRQVLSLASADREARKFVITASIGAPWLNISPAAGSLDGAGTTSVVVTANPAGLPKGTYTARLSITDPGSAEYVVVPVTMTVSGSAQQLRLSATGLTFLATPGATTPPQNIAVLNTGLGAMNWSVSTSTLTGDPGWLVAGPASGASAAGGSPSHLEVRTIPVGLAPGAYYGLVTVSAPAADNSPQSAVALLVVSPADQPPGPAVVPEGLIFTSSTPQFLRVSNISARDSQFTAGVNFPGGRSWLSLSPTSGTLTPGQTATLQVQPVVTGVPAGIHSAAIDFRFQPGNLARTVNLLLVVAGENLNSSARQAAAGCSSERLLPIFRSPGQGFAVTAGWPALIEVEVVDNCGAPFNSGSVTARFSNNDPPLPLLSLGQGRWTATWASRASRGGNVEITVRAQSQLVGETSLMGGVKENPDQPSIAPGGVLNGASFRRDAPVAPGGYLSIFGSGLARETRLAGSLPLPVELGATTVAIAGRGLPLHFTSNGQLNGVLPYGVPDSTPQQMIVRKGQAYSLPETVLVAASEPAVFTTSGTGSGQGHICVATEDGLRLEDASRPAKSGEVLVLYATGLGPVSPPVPDGAPAPADPLSRTVTAVTATIQGQDSEVTFAGLAPGYVGVSQLNIVVPPSLHADASALLILNIGQQSSSPPVTLAVAGSLPEDR